MIQQHVDQVLARPLLGIARGLHRVFGSRGECRECRRIGESAAAGGRPLFFAEGTLQRMTGLLPFQMGAFVAAAQAGVPVVPVTIRGTRSKLRGDSWFLRRGAVSVRISPPIRPMGSDWNGAVRLRDAVRAEILRHCGEPDLAGHYTSLAQMDLSRPDPTKEGGPGPGE